MVDFFYRDVRGEVNPASGTDFSIIGDGVLLWVDLCDPSGEEKRSVEAYLGSIIQSRATAEEIESSSRYYETASAIFANTNFVSPGPEDYNIATVSFMLAGNVLATLREGPIRSFTELQRRLIAFPENYPTGHELFTSILEQRTDRDADLIELMSKEIEQMNKKVSLGEDINEEFLLDINQLQENIMVVRENIVDKQRVISSLLKSSKFPTSLEPKLNVLLKDISSLINHTNFCFERLEYLQNTVIGLINLEQNKIMKVFTLVSLLLMPPTLVTSFYGMNVKLPIMGESEAGGTLWDPLIIIGIMVFSFVIVLFVFRKKKML